jgi:hypothetical protein
MKNEFPTAGCGVDIFRQTLKADVSAVQISDPFNEVFEGSAKSVKPPDNKGISRPDVVKRLGQAFSLFGCATYGVGVDFETAGSTECILLEVEVLFGG